MIDVLDFNEIPSSVHPEKMRSTYIQNNIYKRIEYSRATAHALLIECDWAAVRQLSRKIVLYNIYNRCPEI